MTAALRVTFLVILTLLLARCSSEPEPAPAAIDSLTTAAVDTALQSPTSVPDSTATMTAALLDSLRTDISRLQATLAVLEQRDSLVRADVAVPPSDTAKANTRDEVVAEARQAVTHYGLRFFFAILVIIAAFYVIRGTVYVLERLSERSAAQRLFYKRLVPIARIMMWALAIVFVIRGIFQIGAEGLIGAAAAVGVAIGFAAQDVLKNIFGGLLIVFDQPFQVGDKISVGGTYGEVVGIGLRSTRIVTPDDNLVSVPNSQVVDGQVSNANAGALDCQVVTDLYLPGWVDESKAKQIAYEVAISSKFVYLQKPVVVIVKDEFKETFITHLKVKAYVLDTRYEFVFMSDVTERARAEFRRQGLLQPMHGARAYVDLSSLPPQNGPASAEAGNNPS